jgi:hypothetical protein
MLAHAEKYREPFEAYLSGGAPAARLRRRRQPRQVVSIAAGVAIAAGPCASKVLACGAPQLAAHPCVGSATLHYISQRRAKVLPPCRSSGRSQLLRPGVGCVLALPLDTPTAGSIGLTDRSTSQGVRSPQDRSTRRSLPLCKHSGAAPAAAVRAAPCWDSEAPVRLGCDAPAGREAHPTLCLLGAG